MDPPSMHAKLLDVNMTSTLHGTQFDVDPMCLEANLVSGQFSKLEVVNGNMDSSNKGNSVMPLHENGPSSAKDVCSTAPIQTVPAINSLVHTVSTTMRPSQRPPIPYTTHMVRNDCYGSS
ncbi:hypothetical protein Q3G72_018797 [Acer saccharum]|nr:hypothetical protein Q3G72_018797 [Acer saccharum]